MDPFTRRGKHVTFSSVTGKLTGSSKQSHSVVSSDRRGAISTRVVHTQEFFIETDDGREASYQLNADIPVREGQTVSMISGSDGRTDLPMRLVNYNTGECWPAYNDGLAVRKWRLSRGAGWSMLIGVSVVIVGEFIAGNLAITGLVNEMNVTYACGLPLLLGAVVVGRDFLRWRKAARLLGQHCDRLGNEMLAAYRPTTAAVPQPAYTRPAAPASPVPYLNSAVANPPPPAIQALPINPAALAQAASPSEPASPMIGRSYCIKCGSPLPFGAGFCGTCGTKLE